jgi:hypothetical protein
MGLLNDILSTQSASRDSLAMRTLIKTRLALTPDIKVVEDKAGNIYAYKGVVTKGNYYPAFACHTDTVHDIRNVYKVFRSSKHIWSAMTLDDDGKPSPTGIGGDDKCGIFLCIKLLEALPVVKAVFFADEEIGCLGAEQSRTEFFHDCRWVIECDRRGNSDLITWGQGIYTCSDEFIADISKVGKRFGYKPERGLYTDITMLQKAGRLPVSALNISVGYHNPHSPREYIVERELLTAFELCRATARELTEQYKYNATLKVKEDLPFLPKNSPSKQGRHCSRIGCSQELTPVDGVLCMMCEWNRLHNINRCPSCKDGMLRTRVEYATIECDTCSREILHRKPTGNDAYGWGI